MPLAASLALPFASFRVNRIAPADPRSLTEALGAPVAGFAVAAVLLAVLALLRLRRPGWRLAVLGALLAGSMVLIGWGADRLAAGASPAARVAPGAGYWFGFAALGMLTVDALARLNPRPVTRLLLLAVAVAMVAGLLRSGMLDDLSVMQEYRNRAAGFWREGGRHLTLAFGSFLAALLVGLPLGVGLARRAGLRPAVLNGLTLVQTIPSIALFGMLIVPLAWVAANVPGAQALGIRGIGMAPALVALFLYSLLPIAANTAAGLLEVPRAVRDAADGMGLTPRQRLGMVDIPLALPAILAGARIVLVQNIGMATIGALIGAGGFGSFVFQGIGQTAPDLILLGALPTVALAFATSAAMDALIGLLPGAPR